MGLILDSSLLIADERAQFALSNWLRSRPPEPVAAGAITFSELCFGLEIETNSARARRRRRWLEKIFRHLEIVPLAATLARTHTRLWSQLSKSGELIGPHDLIVAATAIHRRWAVATFNAAEFQQVRGLTGTMQLADRRRPGGSRRWKSGRSILTHAFGSPFSESFALAKALAPAPFGRCEPPRRRRSYCMVSA